jgi:Zn-dependent protease
MALAALAALDLEALRQGALWMILLISAIALHEFGHAWMADRRGDPLPRAQGRVTLDPLAHIDPVGTLLIPGVMIFWPVFFGGGAPFALIGWGKPVQVLLPNPRTRRMDDVLITLAGPAMNLVLCFAFTLALVLHGRLGGGLDLQQFLVGGLALNAGLMVFNLLPIPPLDGGRLLRRAVGMSEETFMRVASIAPWVLLFLINTSFFRGFLGTLLRGAVTPFIWVAELLGR